MDGHTDLTCAHGCDNLHFRMTAVKGVFGGYFFLVSCPCTPHECWSIDGRGEVLAVA